MKTLCKAKFLEFVLNKIVNQKFINLDFENLCKITVAIYRVSLISQIYLILYSNAYLNY